MTEKKHEILVATGSFKGDYEEYKVVTKWCLEAIYEASRITRVEKKNVIIMFKDVLIKIRAESDPKRIHQAWVRALKCPLPRTVGPSPKTWLEVLANAFLWTIDSYGKPFNLVSSE